MNSTIFGWVVLLLFISAVTTCAWYEGEIARKQRDLWLERAESAGCYRTSFVCCASAGVVRTKAVWSCPDGNSYLEP